MDNFRKRHFKIETRKLVVECQYPELPLTLILAYVDRVNQAKTMTIARNIAKEIGDLGFNITFSVSYTTNKKGKQKNEERRD